MTDDERRELRDLMQAHDQMMTEHQEWMAAREAAATSPVQKSDGDGLVYRTMNGNAPAPAPQTGAEPSEEGLNLFGDERDQILAHAVGYAIAELRAEFERKTNKLRREMTALHRQVDAHTESAIEIYCTNVERRLSILEGENIRLKAMLDSRRRKNG